MCYLPINLYGRPRSECRPSSDVRRASNVIIITPHIITFHNFPHPTVIVDVFICCVCSFCCHFIACAGNFHVIFPLCFSRHFMGVIATYLLSVSSSSDKWNRMQCRFMLANIQLRVRVLLAKHFVRSVDLQSSDSVSVWRQQQRRGLDLRRRLYQKQK